MLPPNYRLRRIKPSDAKALYRLAMDIDGINADPGRPRYLRRMMDSWAAYPDAPEMVENWHQNQHTGLRAVSRQLISVRVAAAGGRAAGFSYLAPPGKWTASRRTMPTPDRARLGERLCELNLLAVHPGHRGRGIGTALLEDAETRCRDAGYRALMVMVYDATGTSPVTDWYRQRGYTFGLSGLPWRVLPWTEQAFDVEYDQLDDGEIIGFKSLHPGVAVEAAQIRTASALGVRNAAVPTIAGLLDD